MVQVPMAGGAFAMIKAFFGGRGRSEKPMEKQMDPMGKH